MKNFSHSSGKTLISIALAIVLAVLGSWFLYTSNITNNVVEVSAGSTDNLSGYAWSSNIGWISFNCTNEGSCGTSNYGVHITNDAARFIPGVTSDLTGTAWSSNIGWISFDRSKTSNPPEAPFNGVSGTIAQIDWDSKQISGWARALSGCQENATQASTCAGTAAGFVTGGWDGWIKLSGTIDPPGSGTYGVTLDNSTNKLSGYAWGGDVVGWVKFASTGAEPSYGVEFNPIGTPPPQGCGELNGVATSTTPMPSSKRCSSGAAVTGPTQSVTTPYKWDWTCTNAPNPNVDCSAPFPQCSDGIDNDGDTTLDFGSDTGCSSASDNTERDFKFIEF